MCQSSSTSINETVQTTAEQAPDETNIETVIKEVSPADPRVRNKAGYRSPKPGEDIISMTVNEAEFDTNYE